jgi:hypothetical protein
MSIMMPELYQLLDQLGLGGWFHNSDTMLDNSTMIFSWIEIRCIAMLWESLSVTVVEESFDCFGNGEMPHVA